MFAEVDGGATRRCRALGDVQLASFSVFNDIVPAQA
jgi:hypothetical protein